MFDVLKVTPEEYAVSDVKVFVHSFLFFFFKKGEMFSKHKCDVLT